MSESHTFEARSARLAPVEALIVAARNGAAEAGTLLAKSFPGLEASAEEVARMRELLGQSSPVGLGMGGVAVWHDAALFAVSSTRLPMLSVDDGGPLPMTRVPGTSHWFRVETIEPGLLHSFRYGVDGEWAPDEDVAGYNQYSYELPDVAHGTISEKRTVSSEIYPGATTDYWLYINHGIDEVRGAPVMVWHDGHGCLEPSDLFGLRLQIVTDNLAHLGLIPPIVHVLVSPSSGGNEAQQVTDYSSYPMSMRCLQYDTMSDRYGRHLVEEVLPDVERTAKLRQDAYSRGSAGGSSGGLCAFKLAWFQPDAFSRVHSAVGSFTGVRWDPDQGLDGGFMFSNWVRREPRRNIRVWMSDGMNDFEDKNNSLSFRFVAGSWPLNNIQLANALKGNGYDFHFRFGEGYHSGAQVALDLPESLAWLWRDYDPDRTEQIFEQEVAERGKPMFRVRIANRDAW
jgi:enterochelin esterase family protein